MEPLVAASQSPLAMSYPVVQGVRLLLLGAAFGALAAAVPDALRNLGFDRLLALRAMFVAYAGVRVLLCVLYARLGARSATGHVGVPAPLGPSRGIVVKLAALFSVDAFAGGLLVNSLLTLWLLERFELSLCLRHVGGDPTRTSRRRELYGRATQSGRGAKPLLRWRIACERLAGCVAGGLRLSQDRL